MVNVKPTIDKKEREFADELAKHEDKWVAIKRDASGEKIVASGDRFSDAKRAADSKKVGNVVYRKVPSTKKIFIA